MRALGLTVLRLAVAGIFLYAAVGKLADVQAFAEELANFRVLLPATVPLAAAALPGVELLVGVLLAVGIATRAAAAAASGLLLVFTAGLSQALVRGIDLRCGCFGGADVATWGTVVRDLLMLAPALLVLRGGAGRFALRAED